MTYNPKKDRPRTLDEWEILITDTLADEAAKAQADPFYTPMNRAEVEAHFAFLYPRDEPTFGYYKLKDGKIYSAINEKFIAPSADIHPKEIGTIEDLKQILRADGFTVPVLLLTFEELQNEILEELNEYISKAIIKGFHYTVNGQNLHFSFKDNDQRNFANYANMANLALAQKSAELIEWQGWTNEEHTKPISLEFSPQLFLEFYAKGAMAHLNTCLNEGREWKKQFREAKSKEQLVSMSASWAKKHPA